MGLGSSRGFTKEGKKITPQIQKRDPLTRSYVEGPTEPPLLQQTIPEHFDSIVSQYGSNIAVMSPSQDKQLTYRDLDEHSNALAHAWQALGVVKGDRVAVSLGNSWEFAVATYAIWKLGAVLVPLNPAFNSTQVVSALNHLQIAYLMIGTETHLPFKPPRENINLLKDIIGDLNREKIQSEAVPSLRNVILVNNSIEERSKPEPSFPSTTPFFPVMSAFFSTRTQPVTPSSPLHKDDIINIQFTSGTTSTPKAACLTHHSILNNGHSIGTRMGLLPTDIVCCPPPLFHCFGSILGYMATATHGSAILFPSPAFSPRDTLLSIQRYRATALYGVATMFIAELDLLQAGFIGKPDFQHLRTGIAAGSSVPKALMEKLHRELNLTGLTICYGMTETSPVSCMTTPDDPMDKRLDSVGRVLPHVSAKIVAPGAPERILPMGEKGELAVSGYLVMKHYYDDPVRTEEVLKRDEDGKVWMLTGDEACMDEEGYVKITGRIKDLIIRGGENIHPLEVENCILGMGERISDVSVVGISDEKYGEVVVAFVVPANEFPIGWDDRGSKPVRSTVWSNLVSQETEFTPQEIKDHAERAFSTEVCVLGAGLPEDGEWEDSEV
ncbi:AMP-binding enzyme protein [Rutstroemia sp. NJR-2017a WRK4]|nr:AMP-binding enzyme protein [Rutstroemia sp. NJR-2017a WRK4]